MENSSRLANSAYGLRSLPGRNSSGPVAPTDCLGERQSGCVLEVATQGHLGNLDLAARRAVLAAAATPFGVNSGVGIGSSQLLTGQGESRRNTLGDFEGSAALSVSTPPGHNHPTH